MSAVVDGGPMETDMRKSENNGSGSAHDNREGMVITVVCGDVIPVKMTVLVM